MKSRKNKCARFVLALAALALHSSALQPAKAGSWTTNGLMTVGRFGHTATLLPNGQLLVAGGTASGFASAELYDPASQTWSPTGDLNVPRANHTATMLTNGLVLLAGGAPANVFSSPTAGVELYDPGSG